MKLKTYLTFALCVIASTIFAQKNIGEIKDSIIQEARKLYRSEMASWNGTDLFLAELDDREKLGGYFSYFLGDKTLTIFFSRDTTPQVIGTITFDDTFNPDHAKVDLTERAFNKEEKNLFDLRESALKTIRKDTLFKTYNNTNLNLIPLIEGNERKLYILTGTSLKNTLIIGNDYLMTFNDNNEVLTQKKLHQNIIPISYGNDEEGNKIEMTIHSHLPETGEYITATDLCTLMLYQSLTNWKSHQVVGPNYLNIWDSDSDNLIIIPRKAFENSKNAKKKTKENKKSR